MKAAQVLLRSFGALLGILLIGLPVFLIRSPVGASDIVFVIGAMVFGAYCINYSATGRASFFKHHKTPAVPSYLNNRARFIAVSVVVWAFIGAAALIYFAVRGVPIGPVEVVFGLFVATGTGAISSVILWEVYIKGQIEQLRWGADKLE